jgi:2-keto-4-pentenoate hydratase/2-oxohepta-3-ene-1,7-dioic acid hydratase in catechol pathway
LVFRTERSVVSALKLAHFVKDGAQSLGIVDRGLIFAITDRNTTMDKTLADGMLDEITRMSGKISAKGKGIPIESATLLTPILNPEKILLVARNYTSHVSEQGQTPPKEPYFFTKFRNALLAPNQPILVPKISSMMDWEVELAVVIGRTGKYIRREEAFDYVAGYTVANDVSFRDLQFSTRLPNGTTILGMNWVKGKCLDSSLPLGPWLVTKDEIPDPHRLKISLAVNGETKQDSNTEDMIFRIDSLIEYVSAGMTLRPGDVISTGTPQGVAEFTGGRYLKDGDIVEGKIERIGTLRNPVMAER